MAITVWKEKERLVSVILGIYDVIFLSREGLFSHSEGTLAGRGTANKSRSMTKRGTVDPADFGEFFVANAAPTLGQWLSICKGGWRDGNALNPPIGWFVLIHAVQDFALDAAFVFNIEKVLFPRTARRFKHDQFTILGARVNRSTHNIERGKPAVD